MTDEQRTRISKFLSKYLRHQPQDLGLTLQPGGWVEVHDLLEKCSRKGFPISLPQLTEVVANNDKQRFSFDESGKRIRANQGHSVEVNLQLEPQEPPALLYHGAPQQFVDAIMEAGLKRMARHHVHLSPDEPTAVKVGARRGRPVVLIVEAGRMHQDGYPYYRSENGVWLTEHVPVGYIRLLGAASEPGRQTRGSTIPIVTQDTEKPRKRSIGPGAVAAVAIALVCSTLLLPLVTEVDFLWGRHGIRFRAGFPPVQFSTFVPDVSQDVTIIRVGPVNYLIQRW